jgi:hypothetical protein
MPQEQVKLSKNVYIDKQPLKERHMSLDNHLNINNTPKKNKKENKNEEKFSKNRSATEEKLRSGAKEY